MEIVIGDILKAEENIICQQVNCKGVMGRGLAKSIKEAYPIVYRRYRQFTNAVGDDTELLGRVQIINVDTDKYVANLFGQYDYGTEDVHINYKCLRECFSYVAEKAKLNKVSVALPYGIGCGLAGGDWDIVKVMIEEEFGGVEYKVYKQFG